MTEQTTVAAPAATTERVYVTNADVIKYAQTKCRTCFGAGIHVTLERDEHGNQRRVERVCEKAARRFLKRNPEVKYDARDGSFYREAA